MDLGPMQQGQVPWSDATRHGSTAKTAAVVPPRALPRPRTTWAKSTAVPGSARSSDGPPQETDAQAEAAAAVDATQLATSKASLPIATHPGAFQGAPVKPRDLRRPSEPAEPPRRHATASVAAEQAAQTPGAFVAQAMAAGAVPPGYDFDAQMRAMQAMMEQMQQPKPAPAPAPAPVPASVPASVPSSVPASVSARAASMPAAFIQAAEQYVARAPVAPKIAPSQKGAASPQQAIAQQQQQQPQQRQLHPFIPGSQPQAAKDPRQRQSHAPNDPQRHQSSHLSSQASAPKTGQDLQAQGQDAGLKKTQWKRQREGPVFAVGSVVQYWSSTKGKWVTTRVKALHRDEQGKVIAYDCSGKAYALATKVRAAPTKLQKQEALAAVNAASAGLPSKPAAATGPADPAAAAAAGTAVAAPPKPVAPARVALPAAIAAKMKKKAQPRVFNVGDRVWYWSSQNRKWLSTRIKQVNRRKDGTISSYDCSGKPKADPRKLRPRPSRNAKAKPNAKAPEQATGPAPGEGAVAPKEAAAAAPKPSATKEGRYHTGQKVMYMSGQLQKYVVSEVVRVLRTESGKRYYDLTVKKMVPERRIRPVPTKGKRAKAGQPAEPAQGSGAPLLFKNDLKPEAQPLSLSKSDLKREAPGPSTPSPSKRRKAEVPPPPPEPELASTSEAPPGPPGPPSPEKTQGVA